ncbi:MAG: hypothetical protein WCY11_08745 [Novosphingobium sp.]|uniref:hypothetical protein n=1 Tax=Tsuneonella sp. CC-YZS046 TaxID=3042152 RepID=UPI002D770FF1|nr:hypothetical protein [Tsuneonella sp. CC-YZS046]WRO67005.1 hypothetical protein U8326_02200 [Tsuneonella sp. CC-YZS046]
MSAWDDYQRATRHYWLAHVTPESVAAALADFSLQPQVSFDWIAEAIKSVPTGLSPFEWDGCEAFTGRAWPPNRTTARDAWRDLSGAIGAVFEIILEKQPELESGINEDDSRRIQAAREALGDLWDVARSRETMDAEPRKYRSTAAKELRIEQALVLSIIFRRAFGRDATIDNREVTAGGLWPDFYRRIMALAFDAPITRRDETVLDEARSQVLEIRRRMRERFGAGEDDEGYLYFGLEN